jgi:hypothetical protein
MSPVTRDTNGEGDVMGCDHFQREKGRRRGSSKVSEADNTTKSDVAAEAATCV